MQWSYLEGHGLLAPLAEFLIQYALDGPEICVSNRFPGDAAAVGPGAPL